MVQETIQQSILLDHKILRNLLKVLEDHLANDAKNLNDIQRIFDHFADELLAHGKSEEKIFYSELVKISSGEEIPAQIEEGKQEHHIMEILIQEMNDIELVSPEWKAKLEVLKENLEHHLTEEEAELIEVSKRTLDKETSKELSEEFQEEKAHNISNEYKI